MRWNKLADDHWVCIVPPDARLTIKLAPKPDGRWNWTITAAGAKSALASGVANSLGAAKNVTEQFVKRSE